MNDIQEETDMAELTAIVRRQQDEIAQLQAQVRELMLDQRVSSST